MPVFMLYLIIYGFRGVTSTAAKGQFQCPRCGPSSYRHQVVKRFFTLYFIPLIPLKKTGEYIECGSCGGTFKLGVLQQPAASTGGPTFEAEYVTALRRTLVMVGIADGVLDPRELWTIQQVFAQLTKRQIGEPEIRAEIDAAARDQRPLAGFLAGLAPRLNPQGKAMVIRAAYQVAAADGVFPHEEWQRLTEIAWALQIEPAEFRRIIDATS
jgi:hypothetical protein